MRALELVVRQNLSCVTDETVRELLPKIGGHNSVRLQGTFVEHGIRQRLEFLEVELRHAEPSQPQLPPGFGERPRRIWSPRRRHLLEVDQLGESGLSKADDALLEVAISQTKIVVHLQKYVQGSKDEAIAPHRSDNPDCIASTYQTGEGLAGLDHVEHFVANLAFQARKQGEGDFRFRLEVISHMARADVELLGDLSDGDGLEPRFVEQAEARLQDALRDRQFILAHKPGNDGALVDRRAEPMRRTQLTAVGIPSNLE